MNRSGGFLQFRDGEFNPATRLSYTFADNQMEALLRQIASTWQQEAYRAILDVARISPNEVLYGSAFWLFYCDYSQILTPSLALNSESFVTTHEDNDAVWSNRWVPAEWKWPVLDSACDSMKPLYALLTGAMQSASRTEWNNLIATHDQMISHVARDLTLQIRQRSTNVSLNVASTFVVAAIDDRRDPVDYNALVRSSVAPDQLVTLEGLIRA